MTLLDQQRDALRSTIDWARKIEEHLADARAARLGEVHFRPGSSGVGMIGLRPELPQLGKSGIRGLERLAQDFDRQFDKHCVSRAPGAPRPEKSLQSWLLAHAYKSSRRIEALRYSGGGEAPVLVTDELSLPVAGGKMVCDLFALDGDRAAVIELKSSRDLKRLVEQVTGYAGLVDQHADLFSELVSVILGRPISFEGPCAKWIVWPAVAGHDQDPREAQLAALGIRLASYTVGPEGYRFALGAPLPTSS